jgi:hypothetical protein
LPGDLVRLLLREAERDGGERLREWRDERLRERRAERGELLRAERLRERRRPPPPPPLPPASVSSTNLMRRTLISLSENRKKLNNKFLK